MRYSHRPFPSYRFIPGQSPHPTRDPAGHSFGIEPDPVRAFTAGDWQHSDSYLYGIDLYNHGYWWEAHEAWEACWIAAGKTSPTGLFLQGLIQVAAGCLKKHQGLADTGRRLAQEGMEKFPRQQVFLGIEIPVLKRALDDFFADRIPAQPVIKLKGLDPL